MAERPLGITIIGILWIIGGLILIIGGVGVASLGGMLLGALGATYGAIMAIIGIIDLILGIGCFKAWPWVWTVGVIITVLSLLSALYAIVTTGWGGLISLVIAGIILYYLFTPDVKTYFGKT